MKTTNTIYIYIYIYIYILLLFYLFFFFFGGGVFLIIDIVEWARKPYSIHTGATVTIITLESEARVSGLKVRSSDCFADHPDVPFFCQES